MKYVCNVLLETFAVMFFETFLLLNNFRVFAVFVFSFFEFLADVFFVGFNIRFLVECSSKSRFIQPNVVQSLLSEDSG